MRRAELDDEPGAAARRRAQARARAAEAQAERLRRAQQRLSDERPSKPGAPKRIASTPKTGREKEPRVSTTDPDARVMRMAAGAFRPAYNVQMGCDPDSLVVVDVGLEPQGADSGQVGPMLQRIDQRYGKPPSFYLADAGFCDLDDIEAAYAGGTLVLVPSNQARHQGAAAYAPRPKDGPGLSAWRRNMREPNGKRWVRGPAARRMRVCAVARTGTGAIARARGASKVRCVALLHALAHNMGLRVPTTEPRRPGSRLNRGSHGPWLATPAPLARNGAATHRLEPAVLLRAQRNQGPKIDHETLRRRPLRPMVRRQGRKNSQPQSPLVGFQGQSPWPFLVHAPIALTPPPRQAAARTNGLRSSPGR